MPKRLEWHERCYQVYALIDPRDNTIRYVGKSGDVQQRYYEHIHLTGGGWKEREWVSELKDLGLSPVLQILETTGVDDASYMRVLQREQYWIDKLLAMGAPLINVSGVTKPYPEYSKFPLILSATQSVSCMTDMTEFERLRINAGVTIVQLANEANVSRGTIEKIEKDQPVRAVLAARACNALSRHLVVSVTYESLGIKVI